MSLELRAYNPVAQTNVSECWEISGAPLYVLLLGRDSPPLFHARTRYQVKGARHNGHTIIGTAPKEWISCLPSFPVRSHSFGAVPTLVCAIETG